jgi:hypothetical protein
MPPSVTRGQHSRATCFRCAVGLKSDCKPAVETSLIEYVCNQASVRSVKANGVMPSNGRYRAPGATEEYGAVVD